VQKSAALPSGVRLQYVEQGSTTGLPVVLLHGLTDSWRSFERVLPYLPGSLRVFAVSLRGHGDSDRPATGYSAKELAADVAALMDTIGIESAVIVGHSMGSSVAQRFAIDHPSRTRGLVLVGSAALWDGLPALEELRRAFATLSDPIDPAFAREFQLSTVARTVPGIVVDTVVGESMKLPARVWKEALAGMWDHNWSAARAQVRTPTLIVWGDRDAITSRAQQAALSSAFRGSRLVVYEGAGHALHWEDPQRFAVELLAFCDSVRTTGTASAARLPKPELGAPSRPALR
jgi:pimeloyl-ACP methyl ester carboxylesterase